MKKPEGTRLSRELLQKQGSLVRVIGLQPVFKDTATVTLTGSADKHPIRIPRNTPKSLLTDSEIEWVLRHNNPSSLPWTSQAVWADLATRAVRELKELRKRYEEDQGLAK